MPLKILVSAGEASGDLYASLVVGELRKLYPDADFFGCTGPQLRAAGVRTIVDSASLAVVGIVEVIAHLPRIRREFHRLLDAARAERPAFALLTDSPDFHLRVAARLHKDAIPVFYLVAPQVWAWRKGRVKTLRRVLRRLLCIFPFEQDFFDRERVPATYIGHPLAALVKPALTREAFFRKHGFDPARPLIAVLPGSRRGESARHLPALCEAAARISAGRKVTFVLPASATAGASFFKERLKNSGIQVIEGESWDAMAHSDLALAASGTVTIEAALLGTPMVTYYKVTPATWFLGKPLVKVPFYCMVNLVAGKQIVPELIQSDMTGERIALEAIRLLDDPAARARMQSGLAEVKAQLSGGGDAPRRAAAIIQEILEGHAAHVS